MERTETVIKAFMNATEEQRNEALQLLTEEERNAFIQAVAWHKLFTNKAYRETVQNAIAETVWAAAH